MFGTDGDKAVIDSFSHEFRFAIHLFCSIHLRKNVKDELFRRKFSDTIVSDIAGDIFGKQVGTTYFEGLVDAENEDVFYKKLEEMRKIWEAKEKEVQIAYLGFTLGFVNTRLTPLYLECSSQLEKKQVLDHRHHHLRPMPANH